MSDAKAREEASEAAVALDKRFFIYDPLGDGFVFYATAAERDDAMEGIVDSYCDERWDEAVTQIEAGYVTHQIVQTEYVPRPERAPDESEAAYIERLCNDGFDGDYEFTCGYELQPLSKPPNDFAALTTERDAMKREMERVYGMKPLVTDSEGKVAAACWITDTVFNDIATLLHPSADVTDAGAVGE